jgi:hypothetical protein
MCIKYAYESRDKFKFDTVESVGLVSASEWEVDVAKLAIPTMAGLAGRSPQATCVISACSETPASQPQELLTKFTASEQHLARRLTAHASATSNLHPAYWSPDPPTYPLRSLAALISRTTACHAGNHKHALTGVLRGCSLGGWRWACEHSVLEGGRVCYAVRVAPTHFTASGQSSVKTTGSQPDNTGRCCGTTRSPRA